MSGWPRTRWNRDLCGAAAPGGGGGGAPGVLTLDLVPLNPQTLELGAELVSPMFNLLESGGGALIVRTLDDDDAGSPPADDVLGAPNPVTRAHTYTKTAIGDAVVFTYSGDDGGGPVQDQETFTWLPRVYLGVAPIPGSVDESFIEGLAESELRADKGISRSNLVWTAGQHLWVAFPVGFNPTDPTDFLVTLGGSGFPGGFVLEQAAVPVTPNTPNGVPLNYDVWRSTGSGTGLTVDLSVAP